MKTRFRTLDFLCKLQVFIGALVIVGSVVFLGISIAAANEPGAPPTPEAAQLLVAGIVVGGIFFGLAIIATAQVYQCLMQIEINTRQLATAAPDATCGSAPIRAPEPSPPPKLPAEPPSFSITGERR
jgi:hypothetical protein